MLKVTDLSAGYGELSVLRDVTFALDRGLTVLLGQNGSGKTTLFRALSGSLKPWRGQVTLDGEDLLALSPRERAGRVAQVFGTHQTLAGITGEQLAEMAFYHAHGLFYTPSKAEKETVLHTARELDAESLLPRLLESMSAGERQCVELVAAICQNTPLLLLDEPTSALDFNRTHDFLSRAKALGTQKTVLASLHDPTLALQYADRILLLKDGSLAGDFIPAQTSATLAESYLKALYPSVSVSLENDTFFVLYRP